MSRVELKTARAGLHRLLRERDPPGLADHETLVYPMVAGGSCAGVPGAYVAVGWSVGRRRIRT